MKLHYILLTGSFLGICYCLVGCGHPKLQHCGNYYEEVSKGNADSLARAEEQAKEIVSAIPEDGFAQGVAEETPQNANATSSQESMGSSYEDDMGADFVKEPSGDSPEVEDVNRRTSEQARREAEELQRKALEEMGL